MMISRYIEMPRIIDVSHLSWLFVRYVARDVLLSSKFGQVFFLRRVLFSPELQAGPLNGHFFGHACQIVNALQQQFSLQMRTWLDLTNYTSAVRWKKVLWSELLKGAPQMSTELAQASVHLASSTIIYHYLVSSAFHHPSIMEHTSA